MCWRFRPALRLTTAHCGAAVAAVATAAAPAVAMVHQLESHQLDQPTHLGVVAVAAVVHQLEPHQLVAAVVQELESQQRHCW